MSGVGVVVMVVLASDLTQRPGPIERGSDEEARELLGRRPPALPALTWLDGRSRTLATLAGRVVVIRNFTDGCPFCVTTMPALERLWREFGSRGVEVLGVYHPKPPRPVDRAQVVAQVGKLGIGFPVAIDADWELVKRWWLAEGRRWTSVTWVLDRAGRVRFVHPGGEYHPGGGPDHERCRQDERRLRSMIATLLAEPAR